MAIRGIGVEGVASEIGALGREKLEVEEEKLINRLCRRFEDERREAYSAINQALDCNVVDREERDGKFFIRIVLEK